MTTPTDEQFMTLALDACRRGVEAGQTPFGACIVRDGGVVASAHNRVWLDTDSTAHAEVCCIRQACVAVGAIDLAGCVIYSTTEPCPMCFGAIHWAKIARIVYGAAIADARDFGFSELDISNRRLKELASSPVDIVDGVMRDEAVELFRDWRARDDHRVY